MSATRSRVPELDGARALAGAWWLAFVVVFFAHVASPRATAAAVDTWWGRAAWSGDRAVDAWLVIAGFVAHGRLTARGPLRARDRARDWAREALAVLTRLGPSYLLVLACVACLPRIPGVWTGVPAAWNVVALNDLVPVARQTMAWTWSIALLVKLRVLAPLLVAGLDAASDRRALAALGTVVAVCACATALTAQRLGLSLADLDLAPDGDVTRWSRAVDAVHAAPHLRAGAFFVGLAAARVDARRPRLDERPLATASIVCVASLSIAVGASLPSAHALPRALHPIAIAVAGPLVAVGVGAWLIVMRSPHPVGQLVARALAAPTLSRVSRLCYPGLLVAPLFGLGATVALGGAGAPLLVFALAVLAPTWLASWTLAATTERASRRLSRRVGAATRPW